MFLVFQKAPSETADVFGCVKCLSDLGVFPFTGSKLGNISKLLAALKCSPSEVSLLKNQMRTAVSAKYLPCAKLEFILFHLK